MVLLNNAIKHGKQDSAIRVAVKGMLNEITIAVHNEGSAILPDKIDTIFERFTYIVKEAEKRDASDGLWLGLYIAREIVTTHGGRIDAISSETEGTTFTVHLRR